MSMPVPPLAQSPSSGMGSDVNQLLKATTQLTTSMQATAQQNEEHQRRTEDLKARERALQEYQSTLLASLPANNSFIASLATSPAGGGASATQAVMPRSASMPVTQLPAPSADPSNPVEWAKNVSSNAWREGLQLIANTAPAQAATIPTNAVAMNSGYPAMPTSNASGGSGNVSFINPLPKGQATSGFGMRKHPIHGTEKMHEGQDLAAPEGTPILAAAAGKVKQKPFNAGGYGNYIDIIHANGTSTRYGHMKNPSPLADGTEVTQGQQIGEVGSTGGSTGPHLHFEVRNTAGKAENPVAYLPDLNKSKKA